MNLLVDGIKAGTVIKTDRATKMTVDGITDTYPIYQVRLEHLYFNDKNDRIATWISQYEAENKKLSLDDIENYNNIIQDFIDKSNHEKLKQTEKNIELIGQQKYGVVLTDGRIIDGNRRFSCLRNLSKKSDRFNYFETVILEKDYVHNAKQIKMLELQVQIGEEARVDYDPIDRLVGVYRDLIKDKLLTIPEYARSTNTTEKDVEKQMEYARLLVEFLETINAPEQFYIAREMDLNGPIVELYGILKKIKYEDKKQEMKCIAFTNFLMKPNSDMTRFIRNLKTVATSKYLDEFIEKEMEISEEVIDDLPEIGKVTQETIAKVRTKKVIVDKLENEMEIASSKAKASEAKNKPVLNLNKAVSYISDIDTNIIKKLSDDQRKEISDAINKIEDAIANIKEVI